MQEVRWEEIFSRKKLIKREAANPFEKLNNMVYAILEEAIISYSIPAGTKLSIVHIADLMNISRTPVKEALEKLRENGLIVTEKKRAIMFLICPTAPWNSFLWREKPWRGRRPFSVPSVISM